MITEVVAPKQVTNPEASVDDTSPYLAYFESFIQDIYLPFLNSIYPYETITNPFDAAFAEYLKEDLQSFNERLASLTILSNDKPFDFTNASYEELLETPVDSAAENLNAVSQDKTPGEVNSQQRDLSHSDSAGSLSSGITNPYVVSNSLYDGSSNSLSLGGALTVNGTNYLVNISQGSFSSSADFSVNVQQQQAQAFALRVALDPAEVQALAALGFAKGIHLLDNVSVTRGDSVALAGISDSLNGPFLLKPIIDNNPNPLLGNLEFLSIDKDGEFTFIARNVIPQAEHFFFQVNELDVTGQVVDQKVAQVHVSEIKDQSYLMTYDDGVFKAEGNVTLTGNTGLLADGAAAGDAQLSVILINPTLNSMDPMSDTYVIVPQTNIFHDFDNFNFADTTLSVRPDGSFVFSTTADVPLVLNYVVSDGLGQMALASATFTPADLTPIVLDLNGNGIELVSAAQSTVTLGDLTNSHNHSPVGWVGEGDGILMYDPDGTGVLSSLNQISFVSYLPGAHTDLEGLSAFDSNHNGSFDNSDDQFNLFSVLFADGSAKALSDLGIVSISLESDHQEAHINGNTVFGQTTYQTADGQTHAAADVALSVGVTLSQETAHIEEQVTKAVVESHF
ncbi:MAG: hypothetical protein AB7I18_04025 [Candidatus Berkiella sp.]